MGLHAFSGPPDHSAAYREVWPDRDLPEVQGLADCWNMPTVRHLQSFSEPFEMRGVSHYVLTLHIAGPGLRRVDGAFDNIGEVDALSLQVPGSGIRIEAQGRRRVDYAHFYFQSGFMEEVAEASGHPTPPQLTDFFARKSVGCEGEARDYVRRAYDSDNPPTGLEMDSRAYLIGLGLLRHLNGTAPEAALSHGRLTDEKVARVTRMVEDRLSDNIRLSDMADEAGLSPYHFARAFKATTGETPLSFVSRLRLERAVDIIKTTQIPIAQIAANTGFSSQSHLARRLKQTIGATATDLRSNQ